MKRRIFMMTALFQLAVPVWMIASQETILRKGDLVRFRTAPVDPYDIFRGRYVALSTDQQSVAFPGNGGWARKQPVYLEISVGEDGFAKVSRAHKNPPDEGIYIKGRALSHRNGTLSFSLPLNRFYMNEEKAPEAERLYREHSTRDKQDAHIDVRVLNGQARIEELYVGGEPIGRFVERLTREK